MKDGRSIDELLKESRTLMSSMKKKICRKCREDKKLFQSGFCKECYLEIDLERQEKREGTRLKDKNGYVRCYNADGKLVLEHRHVMEQHLERPLNDEEVIIWRDKNRSNNDLSNLLLGFKKVALEQLTCNHCGTVGDLKYER